MTAYSRHTVLYNMIRACETLLFSSQKGLYIYWFVGIMVQISFIILFQISQNVFLNFILFMLLLLSLFPACVQFKLTLLNL